MTKLRESIERNHQKGFIFIEPLLALSLIAGSFLVLTHVFNQLLIKNAELTEKQIRWHEAVNRYENHFISSNHFYELNRLFSRPDSQQHPHLSATQKPRFPHRKTPEGRKARKNRHGS
ncbi:MAG: hypothetical protein JHC80_07390 [Polynucleobacter sp.]|nr:hypothetical protein [Polynucleobacter sp.]